MASVLACLPRTPGRGGPESCTPVGSVAHTYRGLRPDEVEDEGAVYCPEILPRVAGKKEEIAGRL